MKNKKRNKSVLYLALAFSFLLIAYVFYVEMQFKRVEQKPFIIASKKNWSHRGYAQNEQEENTITAIALALQNNYKGVEIDLWFKNGQFYLSHDENFADTLPKLETIFRIFPDTYFWLDLKNLSYANYKEVANQLESLKKNKNSYFIESKNGLSLGLLHQKGFQTSYWLTNGNFVRHFIQKSWIFYFKYNGISMPATKYQKESIRKKYKHLNVHLWDKHPNPKFYQWEEVKIILDDNELK